MDSDEEFAMSDGGAPRHGEPSSGSDADMDLPLEAVCTPQKVAKINIGDLFQCPQGSAFRDGPCSPVFTEHRARQFSVGELCARSPNTAQSSQATGDRCIQVVQGAITLEVVAEWHPNRVWCLAFDQVIKPFLPFPTYRLAGKGHAWWKLLNELADNSLKDLTEQHRSKGRNRGKDTFHLLASRITGRSWRESREVSVHMWNKASAADRFRWKLMKESGRHPAIGNWFNAGRARFSRKEPERLPIMLAAAAVETAHPMIYEGCVGFMVTYNTSVGLHDPECASLMQEECSQSEFQERLAKHSTYVEAFDQFWVFVQKLGEKFKFQAMGASMELSEHATIKNRVHFHAYLGSNIKGGPSAMCSITKADIGANDLQYMNIKPFVRPTRPRKSHPQTVFNAVAGGLYYVIALKTSTLLRAASMWPIKESELQWFRGLLDVLVHDSQGEVM